MQDGVRHEVVPDAIAHGGGAGRDQRGAREHDRGRLAVARVRHGERGGLVGRPRRDSIHVSRGAKGGDRVGKVRDAVFTNGRGEDLSKSVRRTIAGLRQGRSGVSMRRGG